MSFVHHKSGKLMWNKNRQHGGLEWAWELVHPATKEWKLHIRPKGNHADTVSFEVPGEMREQPGVLEALISSAQKKMVQRMQERVNAIREQRIRRREAEFAAEQERTVQARSVGEPSGEPQASPGEAGSESPSVASNRESGPSPDSEGDRASAEGVQSEPEAPARKTSRPRKGTRSSSSKDSHPG